MSSRPLSGESLSNLTMKFYLLTCYGKFSSPFGGIIIKSRRIYHFWGKRNVFSSPFGGIIIKSERKYRRNPSQEVLVPFRGNHYQIRTAQGNHRQVRAFSSPFGGIIIKSEGIDGFDPEEELFSSPFGGIIIKSKSNVRERTARQQEFSSPFGGIIIKSHGIKSAETDIGGSRPLSGESLSNPCPVRVSIYAALRGSLRRKRKKAVFWGRFQVSAAKRFCWIKKCQVITHI